MDIYGDWKKAMKANIHELDWNKIGQVKPMDLDSPAMLPKRKKKVNPLTAEHNQQLGGKRKRLKNVYVPDAQGLELVPMLEDIQSAECLIKSELLSLISQSKAEGCQSTASSLKSMFACEESLKILPTLAEFELIGKKLKEGKGSASSFRMGCMYDHGDGVKWCDSPEAAPAGANVILGAIVDIEVDGNVISRFVPAEKILDRESGAEIIIPGQRMTSLDGEFIPGKKKCVV